MEIFYVGKGKGRRLLQHLKDAQKGEDINVENRKIQKIREIGDKRLGCTILRRGISDREAFHVEAATIDLLRSTTFWNVKGAILNIQSGHGLNTNGIINIVQFTTMKTKYVDILKSETLLCLNVTMKELIRTPIIPQLIHGKKWRVEEEEARKATYTVVECDNVVIAVFKSDCWKSNNDGKTCTFNGNQITPPLDRLVSHKLPKRKQGTSQARYLNYTDIKTAKGIR